MYNVHYPRCSDAAYGNVLLWGIKGSEIGFGTQFLASTNGAVWPVWKTAAFYQMMVNPQDTTERVLYTFLHGPVDMATRERQGGYVYNVATGAIDDPGLVDDDRVYVDYIPTYCVI